VVIHIYASDVVGAHIKAAGERHRKNCDSAEKLKLSLEWTPESKRKKEDEDEAWNAAHCKGIGEHPISVLMREVKGEPCELNEQTVPVLTWNS